MSKLWSCESLKVGVDAIMEEADKDIEYRALVAQEAALAAKIQAGFLVAGPTIESSCAFWLHGPCARCRSCKHPLASLLQLPLVIMQLLWEHIEHKRAHASKDLGVTGVEELDTADLDTQPATATKSASKNSISLDMSGRCKLTSSTCQRV